MTMKTFFNKQAFEKLPITLRPSDYVDFLLFLSKAKPCIRVGKNTESVYDELAQWCLNYHFAYVKSNDGLMYISKHRTLSHIVMHVDNSLFKHELLLGLLLGYPICCSRKISKIGESNIDEYEKKLAESDSYVHPFNLINPCGYVNGCSLISHIPCCPTCKKSLRIASKAYKIINDNKACQCFSKWKIEWIDNN